MGVRDALASVLAFGPKSRAGVSRGHCRFVEIWANLQIKNDVDYDQYRKFTADSSALFGAMTSRRRNSTLSGGPCGCRPQAGSSPTRQFGCLQPLPGSCRTPDDNITLSSNKRETVLCASLSSRARPYSRRRVYLLRRVGPLAPQPPTAKCRKRSPYIRPCSGPVALMHGPGVLNAPREAGGDFLDLKLEELWAYFVLRIVTR
jgi:hypothetical protein